MRKPLVFYPLFGLFFLLLCGFQQRPIETVCIKKACVKVEVVATDAKRQKGLMFRKRLPVHNGMLFVFQEQQLYPFWMKNMRFALDILWISSDKRIVDIYKNAQPCGQRCESLIPREPAQYVLEVHAGFVEAQKLQIGDSVVFSFLRQNLPAKLTR